jgi:thioredoxin-like negative regulator of GroEL
MSCDLRAGLAVLLLCTTLTGCGTKSRSNVQQSAESTRVAPVISYGHSIDDGDARTFAETIEKTAASGDLAALDKNFDWDELYRIASDGLGVPRASGQEFLKGLTGSLRREGGLMRVIAESGSHGGGFRLVHMQNRKGPKSALFRLNPDDQGGISYLRTILGRRGNGPIKVVDVYVFMAGENLSQTLRRSMLTLLSAQNSRSLLDRLTGKEADFAKAVPTSAALSDAVRNKRGREAMELFDKLPSSLQKDKTYLIMRVIAAQQLNDEEYQRAIESYQSQFPNDPSLDLLVIDSYLIKKQYKQALLSIERLNRAVDGDNYLTLLRAKVDLLMGDLIAAETAAQEAADEDPTLVDARMTLVLVSLRRKDFKETLQRLQALERDYRVRFEDLRTQAEYTEFVNSPQFQEWLKDHPALSK